MLNYNSIAELCAAAEKQEVPISAIVQEDQVLQTGIPADELFIRMDKNFSVMLESIDKGSEPGIISKSGLTGGDGYRLKEKIVSGTHLCGDLIANAIQKALAVSEINAAMGKIVAAPTAGSCGIVPGALGALMSVCKIERRAVVQSLFTAGAIGLVIANKASIAGASGGCQAECGTAAAMAAACIVELRCGTPEMVCHAVAITLKCILGLVCDPVAGLVEIPCIKRNASGVTLAFTAAELALAHIKSAIPADEVIAAMKRIGDNMPAALRETAEGGLAITPTGKLLMEQVFGTQCKACRSCF